MIAFLIVYVLFAILIHVTAVCLIDGEDILVAPERKWLYYLLQLSWGLPMNVIGFVCAAALSLYKRPRMEKWHLVFELPVDFGLNLGLVVIVPKEPARTVVQHEIGHAIQNIYFGPLTIGVVAIPSVIRFWVRKIMRKKGCALPDYDSIWFEGLATTSGQYFVNPQYKEEL